MAAGEAQSAARRKLLAAARQAKPPCGLPPIWFVTDRARSGDILAIANRLPRGWGVILRHFGASDAEATARSLAGICARRGLVLMIAADPMLAARVGVGVHWPEAMLARRGRFPLETAAAHSPRALARARTAGVAAALLSTVFASNSPSARAPIGALKFRQLARASALPVYALGGVTARNAGALFASAGKRAAGFAAVEAIVDAFGDS